MAEDLQQQLIESLHEALRINRLMQKFSQINTMLSEISGLDPEKLFEKVESLFPYLHEAIEKDWQRQEPESDVGGHAPGTMPDGHSRAQLREALDILISPKGRDGIFDGAGHIVRHSNTEAAKILARFYEAVRRIDPPLFDYGNRKTLDAFMIAFSGLPAFQNYYHTSLDFRRFSEVDMQALHAPDTIGISDAHKKAAHQRESLETAFLHALDTSLKRDEVLNGDDPGILPELPNQTIKVMGVPFVTFDGASIEDREGRSIQNDHKRCLVTVNGGLVPYDSIKATLEQEILSGKQIADYEPIKEVIGYLPGTRHLRAEGKQHIDGFPVTPDAAPLLCNDVNILTGLRPLNHGTLLRMLERVPSPEKLTISSLGKNNVTLKQQLLAVANGDKERRIVEVAFEHVNHIVATLDDKVIEILKGKTPLSHPKFIMSMGGTGAGKKLAHESAKAQCGDNYVTASLDDFRGHSDIYSVLTAANHHSDDYKIVQPFANALRTWVTDRARENNISVLYDGSGIDYKPRYSALVSEFKRDNYHTEVYAVDTPLLASLERMQGRLAEEGRTVPWPMSIRKHVDAPSSFLDAVQDPNLDKISLFDNSAEKKYQDDKVHYLVAESFVLDNKGVEELQQEKKNGSLNAVYDLRESEAGILRTIAKGDEKKIVEMISRTPKNKNENNTAYLVYPMSDGKNRVLAIYDAERFKEFIEKGSLNPDAPDKHGLLEVPKNAPFMNKSPWEGRVRNDKAPSEQQI